LNGITYANAVNPTPGVSFAYDSFFRRLASMTDGSGTRQYTYQAIGSPGALQLSQEDGPDNNDTIGYQYDALGRVTARSVDASTESFSYDALGRTTSHARPLGAFDFSYLGQTGQVISQALRGGSVRTDWTYEGNTNDRRLKSNRPLAEFASPRGTASPAKLEARYGYQQRLARHPCVPPV
jgi:YD repeat-containing protein